MQKLTLVLGLVSLSAGCVDLARNPSADARFQGLADSFVRTHFAYRPLEGVALGWHQYDGQFVVPDKSSIDSEIERLRHYDREFASLSADLISLPNRQDLNILRSVIAGQRWALETQHAPTRNPMLYAGALDVSVYLKRNFKPLPNRLEDMARILAHAPALFVAARSNLDPVLPKSFVETAIDIAQGTASFIEQDLAKAGAGVTNFQIRAEFNDAREVAVSQLRAFVAWLKAERLPTSDNSFALGQDGYAEMLRTELIDLTPEEILEIGLRELRAEQERFAKAAALIDPNQKPVDVFKSIQGDHPTAADLIPSTRQDLETIRQFVLQHRIVTIPSGVRARVEETLPPFRSTSFASMDTPGPFEKKATEAYYYVTPVEPDWPPQQAEEWLTAFNYYTTDVVSIHEVYPGHYVQFLALNASPASQIAKAFYSYPFVEGWAHYAEQMMLDEGFGQASNPAVSTRDELIPGAKYRLAQSDEALLRLCRLCVSIKLHTQGMSVEEATRFFKDNCYYEEKPAHQEALRGTFDPGYLYYSLGKLMILKLRHDWQAQEGRAFTLQRFHDQFLRHGAPPIPLLREMLIKDPKTRAELL